MIEQSKIICEPSFAFKEMISPLDNTSTISKSLYTAEEGNMNDFEYKAITSIAALPNIKWWHRNISRNEFCINGFINHYPDFIVMTTSGRIIVIETKGDHLENFETRQKIKLGRAWQNANSDKFRYYMVFQNKDLNIDGAYHLDSFMDIIKEL
jgi:type III restriction enzyme